MTKHSGKVPNDRKDRERNKKGILRSIYNSLVRLNVSNQDAIALLRVMSSVEKEIYCLEKSISNSIDIVSNSLDSVSDLVENMEQLRIDHSLTCNSGNVHISGEGIK